MWNFKGTLWNSTQNILPIHWKIQFLYKCEILRALRFKSSYVFLKRPPGHSVPMTGSIPIFIEIFKWNICSVIWHVYAISYIIILVTFVTAITLWISIVCLSWHKHWGFMMASSYGNNFRVTGFCEGNPPVTVGFLTQRPASRNFDVFFDLRLNSWATNRDAGILRRHLLWRHCNATGFPKEYSYVQSQNPFLYICQMLLIMNCRTKTTNHHPRFLIFSSEWTNE